MNQFKLSLSKTFCKWSLYSHLTFLNFSKLFAIFQSFFSHPIFHSKYQTSHTHKSPFFHQNHKSKFHIILTNCVLTCPAIFCSLENEGKFFQIMSRSRCNLISLSFLMSFFLTVDIANLSFEIFRFLLGCFILFAKGVDRGDSWDSSSWNDQRNTMGNLEKKTT